MIIDWPITSALHPHRGGGYPLVLLVEGGDLAAGELGLGI